MFAAWYPIKQMSVVRNFHAGLASSGIRNIIAVELHLRDTTTPDRLNGCGLIVVGPPYQFEDQAQSIASAVLHGLEDGEIGAGTAMIRLAHE
jgi:23S rRNA (adenine2030-N6)-methyltransferase